VEAHKKDNMRLLKKIYSWILGIDLNRDGVSDVEQVKKAHEELKERVRRVKEESQDVVKAVKEVGKQSKDVIDAASGKKRRGRPKKK
jgi:methyl-accepting chemotaxis protein